MLSKAHQELSREFAFFRQTFASQIGGLGARWGLQTEESFRDGMRTILQGIGFTAERFLTSPTAPTQYSNTLSPHHSNTVAIPDNV